jgi:hypothetical protein
MASRSLPCQCRHTFCARRDDCGFSHVVPVLCNGKNCGQTCRFAHPTTRHCRNGTTCPQRSACQFVHTDVKCTPTVCSHWMHGYCERYALGTCTFGHPEPKVCPSLCTPGCDCGDMMCPFAHPALEWCHFGSRCTNVSCTRAHGIRTVVQASTSVVPPVIELPAITPTQKTYTDVNVCATYPFAHPVFDWCHFGSRRTNVPCTRAHGTRTAMQTLTSVISPARKTYTDVNVCATCPFAHTVLE